MAAAGTLTNLKLSYKRDNILTRTTMTYLANCAKLKVLEFASPAELIPQVPPQHLNNLKVFLKHKKSSLQSLKLYDCDGEVLKMLAKGPEAQSLEEL